MSQEIIKEVSGVGALVIVPEDLRRGFLTITELRTKRLTGKIAGMRSLPMETVEPGETHHQALRRALWGEEVCLKNFDGDINLTRIMLGRYELSPSVVLHAYAIEVPPDVEIVTGSERQEIDGVGWTEFTKVINEPKGSLRFRPAVREVVKSYLKYVIDPFSYVSPLYRAEELEDRVPDEIFDLIEKGVMRNRVEFLRVPPSQP